MALVPVGCRSSPGLTCCPREGGDSSIVLVAARGQRQTNGIRSHLRDEDHIRALQAGSSSIVILKLSNAVSTSDSARNREQMSQLGADGPLLLAAESRRPFCRHLLV